MTEETKPIKGKCKECKGELSISDKPPRSNSVRLSHIVWCRKCGRWWETDNPEKYRGAVA